LPKEFDMSNLIDYDIQFQKTYLNPLEGILQPIGWEWERKSSLDSFF